MSYSKEELSKYRIERAKEAIEEAKANTSYTPYLRELKSLSNFLIKNKLNRAIVTPIDVNDEIQFDGYTFDYMPSSLYCYTIGRRTLE